MPEIIMNKSSQGVVKQYGRVDLVICLDTTGSMSPIIDAVRDLIISHLINPLKNHIAKSQSQLDWRARLIGYGDIKSTPFFYSPFTNNESEIIEYIRNVTRSGGITEYALDALIACAQSPWRTDVSAHRIVVLFTDEPSYPFFFGSYNISDVDQVIKEFTNQKIKLFLFGPEDETFNKLNKIPKSEISLFPHEKIDEMLTHLEFKKIFEQMAKTISNEVVKSPIILR